MSVISVEKDPESLTMTVTADLDATVERVWELWADPRQFEQWWGPPGYQATVVDHDLRTGGRIIFFMGNEDERHDSAWEVIAADPPRHLELRDADVDDSGRPNDGNAMTAMVITMEERDAGGTAYGHPHPLRLAGGHGGGACYGGRRRYAPGLLAVEAVLAGTPA